MKNVIIFGAFIVLTVGLVFGLSTGDANDSTEKKETNVSASFYDVNALDIEGNDVSLSKYKGDVVMFVNTASKCGYTPQYEGLQALYEKYKDRGFVILGFPANNFGGQEPGTNEEIKEFCTMRFKVSFPMFAKISVKGDDMHPLYKLLTTSEGFSGDVTWNFNKFLAGHDGTIINRFDSKIKPESEEIADAVEAALNARDESTKESGSK